MLLGKKELMTEVFRLLSEHQQARDLPYLQRVEKDKEVSDRIDELLDEICAYQLATKNAVA